MFGVLHVNSGTNKHVQTLDNGKGSGVWMQ